MLIVFYDMFNRTLVISRQNLIKNAENTVYNPLHVEKLYYRINRIAQMSGRTEQWKTNQRITFSVSLQCDFPNPYHACLTCKL